MASVSYAVFSATIGGEIELGISMEAGACYTYTLKEGCKWRPFEVYVKANIMAYLYYGPATIDFNLIDFGKSKIY